MNATNYDEDIVAWANQQAKFIRSRQFHILLRKINPWQLVFFLSFLVSRDIPQDRIHLAYLYCHVQKS
ncbi:hypothetical protein CEP10_09745 [Cylindrospermopsis raciborskii S07]|uniref:FERM domain-containing protein n=3 Tax=Cylindrospermopsis raciborskii TaxID=77022 RepID=A0A853MCE5_9CYAN|nr:hypothetical protein [Cylindrospermopsis raciborskii]MBA4446165.1 hypothetical protein [Cylindrospermopsis raciborskii CS-506_C]MBA4457020.1 hypothetical protein [Cylindrospermopsis raciborskii CS-506_B]MBA4466378.1 hypothetical protein [Cylindrospermopsis raciborskii CS-506_A]OBU77090.1 hypothetical protein A9P98_12990 [Cylindrospermopsis raciborskii CS-505]PNJ91544.1 hypothetical protein CEP14_16880 [Cylindrospermopsis raciborskii C04]